MPIKKKKPFEQEAVLNRDVKFKPEEPKPKQKFSVSLGGGQREVSQEEFKQIKQQQKILEKRPKQAPTQEERIQRQALAESVNVPVPKFPEKAPEEYITTPYGTKIPKKISEPLAAGLGAAAETGVIGGAAAGAIIGTAALPVIGTAIGGIAGGIIGAFAKGYKNKLKREAAENIAIPYESLSKSRTLMNQLIRDSKRGIDPEMSADAFDMQLENIDKAYADLHLESNRDLNKFLALDTRKELMAFERWYSPGGGRERYIRAMQFSLLNPNPNAPEELPSELELEEMGFQSFE